MKEYCEFRVNEDYADLLFAEDEGKKLGTVRKINLLTSDARFYRMHEINMELQKRQSRAFYTGWYLYRKYSRQELEQAGGYHFIINSAFEPVGEECGTEYDVSASCKECGVGRIQKSHLHLDLRRIPKSRDISRSIAGEIIVSQRVAELIVEHNLTGVECRPVLHKSRYQDDPIEILSTQAGWRLKQKAERIGLNLNSWEFIIWLNKNEQKEAWEKIVNEYSIRQSRKERVELKTLPLRYQLVVTSNPINIIPPTKGGNNPFDEDKIGQYKCPLSHTIGLNLLSELFLKKIDYDKSDFFITKQMSSVVHNKGVLVPEPFFLISKKTMEIFESKKIKGWRVEVAYFR